MVSRVLVQARRQHNFSEVGQTTWLRGLPKNEYIAKTLQQQELRSVCERVHGEDLNSDDRVVRHPKRPRR